MSTASKSTTTIHTTRAKSRNDELDAIELLTADHKEVKKLFKAYDKLAKDGAPASEREESAQQICQMLTVHAQIEEEIFYPAAREGLDDEALIDEAAVEHASCKDLITQIKSMKPDDDLYDAKVKVLGEYIDHHATEEEKELFPKTRRRIDIREVGRALAARKAQLMH